MIDPLSKKTEEEEEEEEEEGPAIDVHRKRFVYRVQPAQTIPSTSNILEVKSNFSSNEEHLKKIATTTNEVTEISTTCSSAAEQQKFESSITEEHSHMDTDKVSKLEQNCHDFECSDAQQFIENFIDNQEEVKTEQHVSQNAENQNNRVLGDSAVQQDHTIIDMIINKPVSIDATFDSLKMNTDMSMDQDSDATLTLKMNAPGFSKSSNYEDIVSEGIIQNVLNGITSTQHGELFGHAAELLNQPDREVTLNETPTDNHEGPEDNINAIMCGLVADGQCVNGGLVTNFNKGLSSKGSEHKDSKVSKESTESKEVVIVEGIHQDVEVVSGLMVDQTKIPADLCDATLTSRESKNVVLAGLTNDGNTIITGLFSGIDAETCNELSVTFAREADVIPVIAGLTEDNVNIVLGLASHLSPGYCQQNEQTINVITNITLDNEVVPGGLSCLSSEKLITNGQSTTNDHAEISGNQEATPENVPSNNHEVSLIRRDSF